jgi:hypothetical protein
VVDYADLGRWLSRRNIALLIAPWLVGLGLLLTNDVHHWMWLAFSVDGTVSALPAAAFWILTLYAYLLFLAIVVILIRLFVRSPAHRPPVVLILTAMLITHAAYLLDAANANPVAPLDITIRMEGGQEERQMTLPRMRSKRICCRSSSGMIRIVLSP